MISERIRPWLQQNAVVLIAAVLATCSALVVPPDGDYVEYFDMRTLTALFCAMAVVCALDRCGFIAAMAARVVHHSKTRRGMIAGLVTATGLGAMIISNDMALLTFLPLTYLALSATDNLRYLAFTFVMEAVSANLAGMITPFGSPQNLFLYSYFTIEPQEFFGVMVAPFAISVVAIVGLCFLVRNAPIKEITLDHAFTRWPTYAYLGLFALTVAIVFRAVPVWAGVVVPLVLLWLDRGALAKMDHGLLLTFVFFFVFTGNLARVDTLDHALSDALDHNVMLLSVLASQIISNVPTAILFAQFTAEYRELLLGVNIGGVGTIVASLASVIALSEYRGYQPGRTKHFMLIFSAINFSLLVLLVAAMSALLAAGVI